MTMRRLSELSRKDLIDMPPLSLLIKPASGKCNLKCDYCFYMDEMAVRETADYGLMSEKTLEEMIKKAFDYADGHISFAFQGGEPTLVGLPFYKRFIELVQQYNTRKIIVNYAIQTNGTLLNEDWIKFFKSYRFLVGISLDGPRDIHDKFRRDCQGVGSHDKVMQIIGMLKTYGVDFNILCVVNQRVAKRAEDVYQFFKKHGFQYLQFIPCIEGYGSSGDESYLLNPKTYGDFLIKVFDLWEKDIYARRFTSIRYFDNLLQIIAGYKPESCELLGFCSPSFVIESDGGIYPCDFYVTDEWRLGNIHEMSFKQITNRGSLITFIEESKIVQEPCKYCEFYKLCGGGCKRQRETGIHKVFMRNKFCLAYKEFLSNRLERLLKIYRYVLKHPFSDYK